MVIFGKMVWNQKPKDIYKDYNSYSVNHFKQKKIVYAILFKQK